MKECTKCEECEERKVREIHQELCEEFDTGIFNIKFKKVDGSIREMKCTRDSKFIPETLNEMLKSKDVQDDDKPVRKQNYQIMRVFDLTTNEWRSFKISSLISKEIEL